MNNSNCPNISSFNFYPYSTSTYNSDMKFMNLPPCGFYPSKLIPGLYFDKPISVEKDNYIKNYQSGLGLSKSKSYNPGLSLALNYYSSMLEIKEK